MAHSVTTPPVPESIGTPPRDRSPGVVARHPFVFIVAPVGLLILLSSIGGGMGMGSAVLGTTALVVPLVVLPVLVGIWGRHKGYDFWPWFLIALVLTAFIGGAVVFALKDAQTRRRGFAATTRTRDADRHADALLRERVKAFVFDRRDPVQAPAPLTDTLKGSASLDRHREERVRAFVFLLRERVKAFVFRRGDPVQASVPLAGALTGSASLDLHRAKASIARRREWLARTRRSRRWCFLLGVPLAAFVVWWGWYYSRHAISPGEHPGPWWPWYLGALLVLIASWFTRVKYWWVIAGGAFWFFVLVPVAAL